MTVKAAARRLKALAAEIPDDGYSRTILSGLSHREDPAHDRSIVLIASALVENALEVAILSKMVQVSTDFRKRLFSYDGNGPLATFDARIKIAFALGLVGPRTKDDLDQIRIIRNHFAHIPDLIDFDTEEIATLCRSFHLQSTFSIVEGISDDPRIIFVNVTLALLSRLKSDMEGDFSNRFGTFSKRSFFLP